LGLDRDAYKLYIYTENLMQKMMEDISVISRPRSLNEKNVITNFNGRKTVHKRTRNNPVIDKVINEGGEIFFNYIDWHGLANEPNLLVLPSTLHYYYDQEELKGVTTLVNMKKLNLIKHLDDFVNTVCGVLSPCSNFIGCFTDNNSKNGDSLGSKMYKKVINFIDSKTDITINRNDVSRLFESYGFKIVDMTEIDGLTYFRTQNTRRIAV